MEDARLTELMRKITPYFDKQLSLQDEKDFLQEIKNHPAGQMAFQKERIIRDKLKSNLYRPPHTEMIGDQIRNRILREKD